MDHIGDCLAIYVSATRIYNIIRWGILLDDMNFTAETSDIETLEDIGSVGLNRNECEYLTWRYREYPENYRFYSMKEGGNCVGYCAVKFVSLAGQNGAEIAEIALLEGQEQWRRKFMHEVFRMLKREGCAFAILKTLAGSEEDNMLNGMQAGAKVTDKKIAIIVDQKDDKTQTSSMIHYIAGERLDIPREGKFIADLFKTETNVSVNRLPMP